MTVHINITIQDTPDGVTVRTYGPLHAETEAAFVARTMVRLAAPLFAGGRPVRIIGADATLVLADPGPTPCPCKNELTRQECETLRCQDCGGSLLA